MPTPTHTVQPKTISYVDAERVLGVSKMTVRRLVQTGRIRRARLGSRVVLNREDIDRLAEGEFEAHR